METSKEELKIKFDLMIENLDMFIYLKTKDRNFRKYRFSVNWNLFEIANIHKIDGEGEQVTNWTQDYKAFIAIKPD